MNKQNLLMRLNQDQRGATMVEYVVIVTLIFIAAIGAWQHLGRSVNQKTERAAGALDAVN